MKPKTTSRISLQYNAVGLPPVRDVLVLGKRHPHGKTGVMECFRFIAPDEFEMFEIDGDSDVAEAVLIHKQILARISADEVIDVLRAHVFPHMVTGEAINVDFDIVTTVEGITLPGKA